jgi:hypothetical protein
MAKKTLKRNIKKQRTPSRRYSIGQHKKRLKKNKLNKKTKLLSKGNTMENTKTLDIEINPDIKDLNRQFMELWNNHRLILVFLLGQGEGFEQIFNDIKDIAGNFPNRFGVWIKQPEKIIPEYYELLTTKIEDNKIGNKKDQDVVQKVTDIILSSSSPKKRLVGSWCTLKELEDITLIDSAFNAAVLRD